MTSQEFAQSQEEGDNNHDIARHGIGAVAMHEAEQTIERTSEISAERQATFFEKNPNGTYYLFCGDDRNLTDESAEALGSNEVEDPNTALRYFGGLIGASRVMAAAIVAQYGPDALKNFQGSFVDFVKDQGRRITATSNVKPGTHSAHDNEGNADHLDENSEKNIGCAYGAGAQVVTQLNSHESLVDLAKAEEQELFGNSDYIDDVAAANQAVEHQFSRGGQLSFNVDRAGLQDLAAPVAILSGAHASVDRAIVAINFYADKVSNPRQANEAGLPYYNNDVTQVAEMLIRANPELDINPRILLAVMDQDIRATREALASQEGKHAADLKIERYGDPEAAIAYLESIKQ